MTSRPPRRGVGVLVSLTTLFLCFVSLELALRILFPPTRFLDKERDCYWALRLAERTSADGGRTYGNARVDERLGWTVVPNLASGRISTSSAGFRGEREYGREKPVGVTRIVALGDSFTFGLGVADEETYCSRLEESRADLEVINLAANGYGTDQQYLSWKTIGIDYRPDAVLLGFYVLDFDRNSLSVRELPKPRFVVDQGTLRLETPRVPSVDEVRRSHAGCAGLSRVGNLATSLARQLDGPEAAAGFRAKEELVAAILRELAASVEGVDARLCVVIIPHRNASSYPMHARIEEIVERTASELGLPVLNLTEECRVWGGTHAVYAADGHWSATGHELASRAILAFLEAEGVL